MIGALKSARARFRNLRYTLRGRQFAEGVHATARQTPPSGALYEYFSSRTEGHGIWKWEHYFPIYERHLSKFVGRQVNILEIGIYAGGSLSMWRDYFGAGCHVYGVDIEPACRAYESEHVSVLIGDQGDRSFWRSAQLPPIDILIDDGGHMPEQMIITLEEMFPRMSPESVYLCEDIHGADNEYLAYVQGIAQSLNTAAYTNDEVGLAAEANGIQRAVAGVHLYPFVTVIERSPQPERLKAPRRGSQWQPF